MTEMMLVDPAKDLGEVPSAAMERIAALRKEAMKGFTPRNYVELPEFSGAAGYVPPVKVTRPVNLVTTPMSASAPRVKRAGARVAVVPTTATAAAAGSFRNVGVRAEKTER